MTGPSVISTTATTNTAPKTSVYSILNNLTTIPFQNLQRHKQH